MIKQNKLYETTVVFAGSESDEKINEQVEWLKNLINSLGGNIKNVITPGRRKLAYPIKKNMTGYYIHVEVEMPGKSVKDLERQYRLNEFVIRYLTIILDASLIMMRERVVKYGAGISFDTQIEKDGSLDESQSSEIGAGIK